MTLRGKVNGRGASLLVGIDIGGTFTDFVVRDERSRTLLVGKVPSRPGAEWEAVLQGLDALQVDLARVRRVIHATTIGTNIVLERKGARAALVTTEGFRDVIEIGRCQRLIPGSLFHIKFVRPKPLIPRSRRFEVRERMLKDGTVATPLTEAALEEVAVALAAAEPEAVAVCFLHSYANPAHERLARTFLTRRFPASHLSTSHEVVGEFREFERFSSTIMNASVAPGTSRYLTRLEAALVERGYRARLQIMSANGGTMTPEAASRLPVRTILSGPVGGVNGAVHVAAGAGFRNLITYDMGGTSTDVCLIQDGRAGTVGWSLLDGYPVKIAQLNINTVGAGGGSLARCDEAGLLRVGPESAGAVPGPACYGKGGTEPTVTDANLVLGRLDATRPLGGRLQLRPDLAGAALARLAQALGRMAIPELADGILRIGVAKMASAIREISVERGHDPREFVLVPFGGAGPMHATFVAEELGIDRILVPCHPGNLSAFGLLVSDLIQDRTETWIIPLEAVSRQALQARWDALRQTLREAIQADGWGPGPILFRYALDLRYRGQAFELTLPLTRPDQPMREIRAAFHKAHEQTYGHSSPGEAVELIALRASAVRTVPKPQADRLPRLTRAGGRPSGGRPVFFGGKFLRTRLYDREALGAGARIRGPAIIEELGATTVVPPRWQLEVGRTGHMLMSR